MAVTPPPPDIAAKLEILRQQAAEKAKQDDQYSRQTDRQYTPVLQPNPNWMPKKDIGGVVRSLATPNNLSRLTDVPYINDAINSAKAGNYGELVGSVANTLMPTSAALATYSPELNQNEDADLNKARYAQGHFGRVQKTWGNGMADGGTIDAMRYALMNKGGGLEKFLESSKEKRRMYHGTRQAGTRSVSKPGHEGIREFVHGIRGMTFVSPDAEFANSYAGRPDEEGHHRPAVYPVHVQTENPFDYENPQHVENVLPHLPYGTDYKWSVVHGKTPEHMREALKSGLWELLEDKDVMDAIRHVGHDAMYMKEGNVKNLGIFDPRRIKSAIGNRGTYDINDPDITKARGGRVTHAHHLEIEEHPL